MIISSASSYRLIENKFFKQIVNDYTSEKLQNRVGLKKLENDYYEAKIKEIKKKNLKN